MIYNVRQQRPSYGPGKMKDNQTTHPELDLSGSPRESDIRELVEMNSCLIVDEGHTYRLSHDQLLQRIRQWLADGYAYRIFRTTRGEAVGYALWREQPDHLFLRQFYIKEMFRRRGYGTYAFHAMRNGPWREWSSVRLDVLDRNDRAQRFWGSLGFGPYARTLELRSDA